MKKSVFSEKNAKPDQQFVSGGTNRLLKIAATVVFLFFLFIPNTWGGCLNVTNPTSSSRWKSTETYTIRWNTTSTQQTVNINLNIGSSRKASVAKNVPNSGEYVWTIPENTLINKNDERNDYIISITTPDCFGDSADFGIYFPVPATPQNFTATAESSTSIKLTWYNVYGATGFEVYDCIENRTVISFDEWFYTIATVRDLSPGTYHSYKMRATSSSGASAYTSCQEATTLQDTPSAPTGFSAAAQSDSSILLSWDSVSSATSYDVHACDGSLITNTSQTSWTVSDLAPGTSYSYKVSAKNSSGSSDFTSCQNATTHEDLAADFTANVTSVTAGAGVTFTDQSKGSPTSWSWSFGDGDTSTQPNPTHTYNTAGTYTVSLAAGNTGGSDTKTKTNYITVTCSAPTADFNGNPTSGNFPLTVQFSDQSSPGSDASMNTYQWDFGDGETGSGSTPSHTYHSANTYTVSLTVTNSCGNQATETKTDYIRITAACPSPTADFSGSPTSGDSPLTVQFDDLSSPGSGVSIDSWEWNFGDGQTDSVANSTHTFESDGTYTVSLTVTNACGEQDTKTISDYITISEIACVPDWTPVVYTNSTTAYGIVTINGEPASAGDFIGAFVDNECRGASEVVIYENVAYATLNIQGTSVETAAFRVWDASDCAARSVSYSAETNPGGDIGYPPDYLPIEAGSLYPGDIDHSGTIDLRDAILALKITAGIYPDEMFLDADISGDGKIGLQEAIYMLRVAAK